MNTKQAFQRVKPLTGQSIKQPICVADPITFATNLNNFYARFDTSFYSRVLPYTRVCLKTKKRMTYYTGALLYPQTLMS